MVYTASLIFAIEGPKEMKMSLVLTEKGLVFL